MQDLTRGVLYGVGGTFVAIAIPIILIVVGVSCIGWFLRRNPTFGGNGH